MAWNAVFPLGTTFINQSVPQFQSNWAFLASNIGKDHFFDTGAPNEGHHKFVQLLDGGAPALAAGMSAVLYSQGTGGGGNVEQPFWRNTTVVNNPMQIPTFITGVTACPAGVQTTTLINMATGPQPNCMGFIQAFAQGGTNSFATGYYTWNGANVYVGTNIMTGVVGTLITNLGNSANSRITITTNFPAGGNVQWAIYLTPI